MQQRRRIKHDLSLEQRLGKEATRLRAEAELLRPGPARDAALKRARQMETASHLNEWLASPGLMQPTR